MKNLCRILALLLTFTLLAGCGSQPGDDSDYDSDSDRSSSRSGEESSSGGGHWGFLPSDPPEPEAPLIPDVAITEPPLTEWVLRQPVPDFLSEEQRQLFLHAYCAASEFLNGSGGLDSFPLKDGSQPSIEYETVEIDGRIYTLAQGRYRRWEDFEAMMDGLFTPEYKRELIGIDSEYGPIFCPTEDGQLCYLDGGRGSDIFYDGIETDTYELVSQTEEELCFNLIGHYTEWDYDPETDQEIQGEPYTQSYPIRMVRTVQGWRVAEIHVPW